MGAKLKIKTMASAAALTLALGMIPSAPAHAADGSSAAADAAAASAKTPPKKVPGAKSRGVAVEVPLAVDAGSGVATEDIIICIITPWGEYIGSGVNLAQAELTCPVTMNSLYLSFQWYDHYTGVPLSYAGKSPCLNNYRCNRADELYSHAMLDVEVCSAAYRAGVAAYRCAIVGPF
jgi:hypothetical protein